MSHFMVSVLLKDVQSEDIPNRQYIYERVSEVLAPYDENLEVDEYDRECSCIGNVARKDAEQAAIKACGTIKSLRGTFVSPFPAKSWFDLSPEEVEIWDAAWDSHISEYNRVKKESFDNHPMKDSPDSTCGFYHGEPQDWWEAGAKEGDRYNDDSGCGATGFYKSTYNPNSKWDWFVIGGRFTGCLVDYDPATDPDNWEQCWKCGGDGMDRDITCNMCKGTGRRVKLTYNESDSDIILINMLKPDFIPYAIVTPDGEWHQRGEMGWFGISNNEVSPKDWEKAVKNIISENSDCVVVAVDCHI